MPIEVIGYQCEYCKTLFKTGDNAYGNCVSHESECSYNPENKKCDTCRWLEYDYGNYSCGKSAHGTFDIWDERLPGCEQYELERND